jgi:predicted PurR-regulated permease PerM
MQPIQAEPQPQRRSQRVALAVLMGLAFLVVAWMAAPLLVGLALGAVMGFTAQPLYWRLVARFNQRHRLASAVTTLLGGLAMAGGGALAIWVIAREVAEAIVLVQRMMGPSGPSFLGPRALRALGALGIHREVLLARLQDQLGHLADLAAQAAGILVQASLGAALTLIVALWTMYYVLIDWPRIAYHLEHVLPLDPLHTRALVAEFRDVGRTAFVGTLAGAIVQGLLAGVGFVALDVPQGVTWAAVLAVASFIPVVGVPLVWVPMVVWLLLEGHVVRAALLTVWCLLIVGVLNDYVIRPRLIGGRGDAHPLLTLVAILGGISVFGVAGVILGPVVMSLFVASARIYERERDLDPAPSVATPTTAGTEATRGSSP